MEPPQCRGRQYLRIRAKHEENTKRIRSEYEANTKRIRAHLPTRRLVRGLLVSCEWLYRSYLRRLSAGVIHREFSHSSRDFLRACKNPPGMAETRHSPFHDGFRSRSPENPELCLGHVADARTTGRRVGAQARRPYYTNRRCERPPEGLAAHVRPVTERRWFQGDDELGAGVPPKFKASGQRCWFLTLLLCLVCPSITGSIEPVVGSSGVATSARSSPFAPGELSCSLKGRGRTVLQRS